MLIKKQKKHNSSEVKTKQSKKKQEMSRTKTSLKEGHVMSKTIKKIVLVGVITAMTTMAAGSAFAAEDTSKTITGAQAASGIFSSVCAVSGTVFALPFNFVGFFTGNSYAVAAGRAIGGGWDGFANEFAVKIGAKAA